MRNRAEGAWAPDSPAVVIRCAPSNDTLLLFENIVQYAMLTMVAQGIAKLEYVRGQLLVVEILRFRC